MISHLVCPSCSGEEHEHKRDCAVVNRQMCDLLHRGQAPVAPAFVERPWPDHAAMD